MSQDIIHLVVLLFAMVGAFMFGWGARAEQENRNISQLRKERSEALAVISLAMKARDWTAVHRAQAEAMTLTTRLLKAELAGR